jgi:hypothetical protein
VIRDLDTHELRLVPKRRNYTKPMRVLGHLFAVVATVAMVAVAALLLAVSWWLLRFAWGLL